MSITTFSPVPRGVSARQDYVIATCWMHDLTDWLSGYFMTANMWAWGDLAGCYLPSWNTAPRWAWKVIDHSERSREHTTPDPSQPARAGWRSIGKPHKELPSQHTKSPGTIKHCFKHLGLRVVLLHGKDNWYNLASTLSSASPILPASVQLWRSPEQSFKCKLPLE